MRFYVLLSDKYVAIFLINKEQKSSLIDF